jgi:transcriptional regulator GlxA family with amidase domain
MELAILVFDRFTALDAVGAFEILSRLPSTTVRWVAAESGTIMSDAGLRVIAEYSFDDVPAPDIVLVPGGSDVTPQMKHARTLEWLRSAHATSQWTTSVCTGSLILGAAGILRGLQATTHWAVLDQLSEFGAIPVDQRVVRAGKIMTSAGVSAGIDMALELTATIAGAPAAQAMQLAIEYDPAPPFNSGSPRTAPSELVSRVRESLLSATERRAAI